MCTLAGFPDCGHGWSRASRRWCLGKRCAEGERLCHVGRVSTSCASRSGLGLCRTPDSCLLRAVGCWVTWEGRVRCELSVYLRGDAFWSAPFSAHSWLKRLSSTCSLRQGAVCTQHQPLRRGEDQGASVPGGCRASQEPQSSSLHQARLGLS